MSAYPWGWTTPATSRRSTCPTPAPDGRRAGLPRAGHAAGAERRARTTGRPSSAQPRRRPATSSARTHRGPQDPAAVICPRPGPDPTPGRCDDTAYGKGTGGQLRYDVTCRPARHATVWFARRRLRPRPRRGALAELRHGAARPGRRCWPRKIAARRRVARATPRSTCPATALLQQSVEWSKQNLADSVQEARDLQLRATNAGTEYPAPAGTVAKARWIGAGWPDYPWLFAHRRRVHRVRGGRAGQFAAVEDHLRALRDVSEIVNGDIAARSCTRSSRTVRSTSAPTPTPATPTRRPSSRARSRWSGAGPATTRSATRSTASPCANMQLRRRRARRRRRRLAGGRSATSSGPAWARRSSTTPSTRCAACTTWPTWRAAKGDAATAAWATRARRRA